MAESDDLRNYLPRTVVCMIIAIVGLGAVPFTGTRYGDRSEASACPKYFFGILRTAHANQH